MAEARDFILARLAVASSHANSATEAINDCINLFVFPTEDKDGSDRSEALDIISSASGELSRAVEAAQEIMDSLSKDELAEGEPDDEEEVSAGADSSTEE